MCHISRGWESWDSSSRSGLMSVYKYLMREGKKDRSRLLSGWPVKEQEAIGVNWNTGILFKYFKIKNHPDSD